MRLLMTASNSTEYDKLVQYNNNVVHDVAVGDDDVDDDGNGDKSSSDADSAALLHAKLQVLQDVVIKLNVSKWQSLEEIQRLQTQVTRLKDAINEQKTRHEMATQAHATELRQRQALWMDQKGALMKQQQQELETASRRWAAEQQARLLVEQEKREQESLYRQSNREWKARKEREWQESLQIATASAAAAETREQAVQAKLERLETRYHREAADYKEELDQLQKEWKIENRRLEKEIKRLQTELIDSKRERDRETSSLMEKLRNQNKLLESELTQARDQIKFQRMQYTTQQQVTHAEWEEQRDKERKFYTEAMRLLQQENAAMRENQGFWTRLFRFRFGSRRRSPKRRAAGPDGVSL